jgi:alpha-1,3-rhamnosyl/mannosyltransferase
MNDGLVQPARFKRQAIEAQSGTDEAKEIDQRMETSVEDHPVSTNEDWGRRRIHVAIDLTALLPEATGVDNYLMRLVMHLSRIDQTNQYTLFVNYEDLDLFRSWPTPNFTIIPCCLRPRPVRLASQQIALPLGARLFGAEVIHSPSFIMPLYRGKQRHLLTIHDMTSFSLPECHIPLRRSALYRRAILTSIRRAHLVTVPSQFTRQAILEFMPDIPPQRIRVISAGVGEEFHLQAANDVQRARSRLRLGFPYILYVGTIEPRKNLQRLLESYKRLIAKGDIREDLVLAGRLGWDYDAILAQANSPALRGRVHLPGYISQSDLPLLYAGARLFVYPSLQEGFGFPPLEAMACGVPSIASLSSSLTENLAGAADLVPPDDTEALTAAMERLLQDDQLHTERRALGLARAAQFRWQETARQTLNCYKALAFSRSGPPAAQ